ncbi:MAG: hypothetical protein JSR34_09135 [Proteobacteria bacterium]|nr:hypothetical protein [Pseudomonadota bacterium]
MKPSSTLLAAILATLIAANLTACDGDTDIGDRNGNHISLLNDVVTMHAKGQPDAVIDASGNLSIGDKPVATTPAQHALLMTYHYQLAGIRKAGIETGMAGANLAVHAMGDTVSGLVHGDADKVSSRIDDRAKAVEAKALAICDNLDALQKTQDQVAAALPAFKPYAAIHVGADHDCRNDTRRHG